MADDPARIAATRGWLVKAAEKALKAFLAWHDVPFRRTHDIEELVTQCAAIDAGMPASIGDGALERSASRRTCSTRSSPGCLTPSHPEPPVPYFPSPSSSTARKASCGISTRPTCFMRFLPSFCFSSSLRLREMSPP